MNESVSISTSELHHDRLFRAAWTLEGNAVECDVELAKPIAKDKVMRWRNAAKFQDVSVDDLGIFSADEESTRQIESAAQAAMIAKLNDAAYSVVWSCCDGKEMTLNGAQIAQIALALSARNNEIFAAARALESRIDGAKNMAEIDMILSELSEPTPS